MRKMFMTFVEILSGQKFNNQVVRSNGTETGVEVGGPLGTG